MYHFPQACLYCKFFRRIIYLDIMNKKINNGDSSKSPFLKTSSSETGRPSLHQKFIRGAIPKPQEKDGMIRIPKPIPREDQTRDNYKL